MLIPDLFTEFNILQNVITDSGKNSLILENIKGAAIYNLLLLLKNAAVSRNAAVSGSNDEHSWYIIDDAIAISRSYETVRDEYVQEINIPPVKYRYLKIIIDNVHNDPLLITKAGFYEKSYLKKSITYQDNPTTKFIQKDSNNYSYILVTQDNNYQFDKIALSVSGPKFYSRDAQVCVAAFEKNQPAKPGTVLGNFKLTSSSPSILSLPTTKASQFFILIKNADNPPLKIEKVITLQQTISLVTYLERNKKYTLLMGDSMASFADYDLQIFKDSISTLRPLHYGNVRAVEKNTIRNTSANKGWWIWPSLIFAGIVLSFLTYRLTRDINKSIEK